MLVRRTLLGRLQLRLWLRLLLRLGRMLLV